MSRILLFALLAVAALPAAGPAQARQARTPAVVELVPVAGPPVRVGAGELARLPRTCVSVKESAGSGHAPLRGRYCGVPLRALLTRIAVPEGTALRGAALRLYVVAEGADGYRALFSLPELDPAFTADPVVLADTRDGRPLDAQEGPFRVVAPAERRPARWIRQLARISVHQAP